MTSLWLFLVVVSLALSGLHWWIERQYRQIRDDARAAIADMAFKRAQLDLDEKLYAAEQEAHEAEVDDAYHRGRLDVVLEIQEAKHAGLKPVVTPDLPRGREIKH